MKIPALKNFVNDISGVLDSKLQNKYDRFAKDLETKTTLQAVTLIFPHRQGNALKKIALEVFNSNKIGQKGKNNGLLLIIASEENKIRIMVGKGLEWTYDQAWCRKLIEKRLRPALNAGDYKSVLKIWHEEILNRQTLAAHKKTIQQATFSVGMLVAMPFLFMSVFLIPWIFLGISFLFPLHFLFLYLAGFLLILCFLYTKTRKIFWKIYIIYLMVCSLFLGTFICKIHSQKKLCIQNPEICEQQKIEEEKTFCSMRPLSCEDGRINHDSTDYKTYQTEIKRSSSRSSSRSNSSSSSSSSSSDSSFGGGGGSTNGSGWGD